MTRVSLLRQGPRPYVFLLSLRLPGQHEKPGLGIVTVRDLPLSPGKSRNAASRIGSMTELSARHLPVLSAVIEDLSRLLSFPSGDSDDADDKSTRVLLRYRGNSAVRAAPIVPRDPALA